MSSVFVRWMLPLAMASAMAWAQPGTLRIYWVDVEGGGATLMISPSGETLLVDSGNINREDRDAKRIAAAAKDAGIAKIDYLLTTHYHIDHAGGAPALAKLIPIGRYLDHGDAIKEDEPTALAWKGYEPLAAGKRTTLKPGDKLPIKGFEAIVVTSNGEVIKKPINGGKENKFCANAEVKPDDITENRLSVGFLATYGKFKFVDLGDLTWDVEMKLACPVNKLGEVTLFQATHHGYNRDQSGNPAQVLALRPQVVVVNNGARKAWNAAAWETTKKIDGLEDIWQIHRNTTTQATQNTAPDQIANLGDAADCEGHWIKAVVQRDGRYTLTNGRNNFSKTYRSR